MTAGFVIAALAALAWLYMALFRGWFWVPHSFANVPAPSVWPDITIVIPARNEADGLPLALPSLLTQDYPGSYRIVLVDDHSTDGTAAVARQLAQDHNAADKIQIISAPDLPQGWTGKVAAMQAGFAHAHSDYVLFTDADIAHAPDSLRQLAAHAIQNDLDLTSRMVRLQTVYPAEKLLIPAFIYFFAMLYPFRLAEAETSDVAAAAGGVMLVRRAALIRAGGLDAIKDALIDDCALARLIKTKGGTDGKKGKIALGLTQSIHSMRPYPHLGDVLHMVARTAFTQLRYSNLLLAGTLAGLGVLFVAPPLLSVFACDAVTRDLALIAWGLLTLLYYPTLRYYGLPRWLAVTLPVAAVLYMAATFESARRTWRGQGGQWKGRNQAIQKP